MASFNQVILMGNLTRDPQVKYTTGGTAVCEVGMAVNDSYKDKNGNKVDSVVFVDVTLWGRTAEVAGEYLAKGRPVMIVGKLKLDTWDDRETGQKRSKLKVTGEQLTMLGQGGGRSGGNQSQSDGGDSGSGSSGEYSGSGSSDPSNPDDVPF